MALDREQIVSLLTRTRLFQAKHLAVQLLIVTFANFCCLVCGVVAECNIASLEPCKPALAV